MRVLLTGGAGFIGSHVAERLLERGHEVAVVDDLSSGRLENLPEGVLFHELDVRGGCGRVFEEFRPEAVSHQAAQMDVRRSVREPDFDAEVNILGTIRLLENCVRYGVRRFVFASTGGAIYGEQERFPATEEHPQYPLSPYGVSKLAGERYLHYYEAQYGLPYVVLRYSNVYGPRQDPHGEAGVVAIFSGNLAAGRTSTINGTGEQTRDYVYVGDVARANLLALESGAPSGVYNIGTGVETSVNELYEKLRRLSGRDLPPEHGPAKPGEQLRSCVSYGKAERLLNWRPEVELDSGLEETLRFFGAI
ncbi:SDR family oxidoreductase [Rubrobacter taiwanensis]|uniref:SDR family oxidoreductase n=1 Tax=Rubrobacter taiwanensis TaxID=185139 RepID=A0A4R1BDR3_9ACTN|nr:SDR family oxidoreductase [Rubrobacter taiwanensis]TCJ15255.1 SDR family oxidoreductase [Rubrobacter taiwanensis]